MGILIKAPTRRRESPMEMVVPAPEQADARSALHIREVVRLTGLRREQLYMWQRRYGFPSPLRASAGRTVTLRTRPGTSGLAPKEEPEVPLSLQASADVRVAAVQRW